MSQYTRAVANSPVFTTRITTLAATGSSGDAVVVDLESDTYNGRAGAAAKYLPANSFRVVNNSSKTIEVWKNCNSGNKRVVFSNQDVVMDEDGWRSAKIVNLSSSALSGTDEIRVEAQRKQYSTENVVRDSIPLLANLLGGLRA